MKLKLSPNRFLDVEFVGYVGEKHVMLRINDHTTKVVERSRVVDDMGKPTEEI